MPAEKNRCPGETCRRVAVLASRPVAGASSFALRRTIKGKIKLLLSPKRRCASPSTFDIDLLESCDES